VNLNSPTSGLSGHSNRRRRAASLLSLLVALALVASACGDGGAGGGGADIEGEVDISGSSTVEPISIRVAELFEDVEPGVTVNVDGPGTGDGFKLFCEGEIDVADASRAIKDEEAAACGEAGVEFIEIKVAFDGMSVLTSPENEIECLSFADLYALVGPESQGFDTWSDAAPLAEELGSNTTFPRAPLDITGPGEESGTYDSFVELAIAGIAEERVASGKLTEAKAEGTRPDYSSQSDDNAIITGIEGSGSSFGWVGFAFAEEAGDNVKEIEISKETGGACVAPSSETIADGSYPLSRPLFIYVNKAAAEENPAIAAYVDFYVGDGVEAVEEVGYVALPDDQLAESTEAWEARTAGTREG
jgi:phosphate transport system substrate-binding protein